MSGFYVLDVPEFLPLIGAVTKAGNCRVHHKVSHYQFVEFVTEIEIRRNDTGMNEAVWFSCLAGGLDGKISHFDSERIKLVATNEPILAAEGE